MRFGHLVARTVVLGGYRGDLIGCAEPVTLGCAIAEPEPDADSDANAQRDPDPDTHPGAHAGAVEDVQIGAVPLPDQVPTDLDRDPRDKQTVGPVR